MKRIRFTLFLISSLLFAIVGARRHPPKGPKDPLPDLVVGRGQGNIPTIKAALEAAMQKKTTINQRIVIRITAGVYDEIVAIDKKLTNLMLIGDGKGKTIITGELSVANNNIHTFQTATVDVRGNGFIARGITFRNTAGPRATQAVALRIKADRTALYDCSIEGYQDTLYAREGRQFYKNCDIYGSVDIIFGDAKAVFQDCNIIARGENNGMITITAQNRNTSHEPTGIVIQRSKIMAEKGANLDGVKGYLGRPWGYYSRVVVMQTEIPSFISPQGWLWWDTKDRAFQNRVYYAEYKNYGPGASTAKRVKWRGFHAITAPRKALGFSVGKFLDGKTWLTSTGVPFDSEL